MGEHIKETWLITKIFAGFEAMDKVITSFIKPEVEAFQESSIKTWHFFREQEKSGLKRPFLLFRVCGNKELLLKTKSDFERKLRKLKEDGLIEDYRVDEKPDYTEEGRYGKGGWPLAQKLFEYTSKVSLFILDHRTKKIPLPPDFREEKFVHCFLNQSRGTHVKEIEFYVDRLDQLSIFRDLPSVADQYAAEFNKQYQAGGVYQVLHELSVKLCKVLNQKVRYMNQTGKTTEVPFENLIWAIELITAAWMGWVLESKAIEHYGKPHPNMREILIRGIIPSMAGSFKAGRQRAMKEKG